ncbi:MAG: hypothetical protein LBD23_13800 [Oscillospiraceae bacterium]|jgi:hypothetical protein|nr:hypothetical protein [Oscillospiraceae bacterium]
MKHKIYVGMLVLAVVMLISGAGILALASPATREDPLITLSYLPGPFRTSVNTHVTNTANTMRRDFNTRVERVETTISDTLTANPAQVFISVLIPNGETQNIPLGAEVMLRSGSANISAGALVNYTAGSSQTSGALIENNMYIATDTTTITATSGNTMILLRG